MGGFRKSLSVELAIFGNAVRDCLGLEPIYTDGRTVGRTSPELTNAERFYIAPFDWPKEARRGKKFFE